MLDLGLMSLEDLRQIVSGETAQGSRDEDVMSVKVCLELINLITNISVVCKDATHSALKYLFTNAKDNKGIKRKSTFNVMDEHDGVSGGKLGKISTHAVNKGCSKVDNTIT